MRACDRNEAPYRLIVEHAGDAIISWQVDGTIATWNRAAERLYGYSSDEIIGQPFTLLIPPPHRRQALLAFERIKDGERVEHYETVCRRKDGGLVDVSLTISPVSDESGRVIGASGVARDITSRRQAEEAFRHFLAATFHDVRNALQLIVGIAVMPPEEQSSISEQARSKLFALVDTINDMMTDLVDHSREGKERIEIEEFSAADFLQECVACIEKPCAEKGLRLAISLPEQGTLRTDRAKLRRILMNLLHNAVRYTPCGGIEVTAKLDAARLRLAIRDTGIGIPEDARARLFEPYYRHERARELQPLGTGLGLSIVKRFCELLGGSVAIESNPGAGTTCRLDLPRELEPQQFT